MVRRFGLISLREYEDATFDSFDSSKWWKSQEYSKNDRSKSEKDRNLSKFLFPVIKGLLVFGNVTRVLSRNWLSLSLSPPLSFSLLSSTYIYTYICSVCQSVRGPIFRVPFLKLFAQKAKLADNGREPPLSAPLLQWILQKRSSFLICFPSFCARKIGVKSGAEKRSEVCVNVVCVKLSFFFFFFYENRGCTVSTCNFLFFLNIHIREKWKMNIWQFNYKYVTKKFIINWW